ncbi:hypothetical protein EV361DRAFT_954722 [Lentinula raphanica]|nr:hypothetical protein EV361DRAFT_954722 [Lentinula raphanica]
MPPKQAATVSSKMKKWTKRLRKNVANASSDNETASENNNTSVSDVENDGEGGDEVIDATEQVKAAKEAAVKQIRKELTKQKSTVYAFYHAEPEIEFDKSESPPTPRWRLFGVSASKRRSAILYFFTRLVPLIATILSSSPSTSPHNGTNGTTSKTSNRGRGTSETTRDDLRGLETARTRSAGQYLLDHRRLASTLLDSQPVPLGSSQPNQTTAPPLRAKSPVPLCQLSSRLPVLPLDTFVIPFSSSSARLYLVWSSLMTLNNRHPSCAL